MWKGVAIGLEFFFVGLKIVLLICFALGPSFSFEEFHNTDEC